MSGDTPIGVGVLGLGFIGATHLRAFAGAAGGRVVAVCDADSARLDGRAGEHGNLGASVGGELFDPGAVMATTEVGALLGDERVELVCICTPTDTHVDLAIRALDAGKHVLVEKPVALSSAEVGRLAEHAQGAGRLCIPAMCMRFWPGWDLLPGLVRGGRYGRVLSARFERLGAAPAWSGFYADASRSGDALFDLHIHDVDMVHRCFGAPSEVRSSGSPGHVTTSYTFGGEGPAAAVAEGGWLSDPGVEFRMRYVVEFERALAEFDLGKSPAMSLFVGGEQHRPALRSETGWEGQARAVIEAVRRGDGRGTPTLAEAIEVTRTVEAEAQSLLTGRPATPERSS